ncbi:LIC_10190 family membrane protein [Chryseobacterium sp.]|uniref:LIC_10190 family membrane protein n=1 Tax=Chryseobacterium sp. TaxID=1871047 RepID=UPI0035C73E79
MILLFFSTLLLLPVLMGIGKITENFSGKLWEGVSGKIFLGILGISLLWTIAAFFISLNSYVEFSTIAIGLIYFFKDKLYKDFIAFSKKDFSLIAAISLIIVYCGSFYPYILDHFGYYVPTIKWLKEFSLVKGISNLDLTLGQMSVWHIFQAGFSNFTDPFLRINSVVLIIYTLYIVEKKSWIQLCFIPVLLLFCQSPSPDLPVIIFSVIILNEILRENKQTTLLFAFSVFVFIIKPTMIWLPVLSFLYSVFILKSNLKNLTLGILIGFLFFVKNIYTFGYPVFPVSIIDLGVSWKPNSEVLKISSQFAIQKTYDMQYSYEEIQKFSAIDYIRNWIFLNGIKAKINLLFIVSLIIFTVFTFIKKNRIITFICISLIIKSILVLLFSAQYRFFMDVFFVIFFLLFVDYFNQKKSLIVFSGLSIIFVSFLTFPNILQTYFPSFNPGNFMGKFEKEQLYKPSVYESTKFDSFRVGNLNFHVSENYPFNYDSKIPAISAGYVSQDEKAGIFPQLIDNTDLKKGFIWKKLNNEERKQAKSVIHTINPLGK